MTETIHTLEPTMCYGGTLNGQLYRGPRRDCLDVMVPNHVNRYLSWSDTSPGANDNAEIHHYRLWTYHNPVTRKLAQVYLFDGLAASERAAIKAMVAKGVTANSD